MLSNYISDFPMLKWFFQICEYFTDLIGRVVCIVQTPIGQLGSYSSSYYNPFAVILNPSLTGETSFGIGAWIEQIKNAEPSGFNLFSQAFSYIFDFVGQLLSILFGADSDMPLGLAILLVVGAIIVILGIVRVIKDSVPLL